MRYPKEIQGSCNILFIRQDGVDDTFRNTSSCCLVTHMSEFLFPKQVFKKFFIPNISFNEGKIRMQFEFSNIFMISIFQVIKAHNNIIEM